VSPPLGGTTRVTPQVAAWIRAAITDPAESGFDREYGMRIATWNVNSVRQRLDHLLTWLRDCAPDIVCLQEIKCVDEAFPREAIEALGYNVVTHGQKTFNGVALLSKYPIEESRLGLAGDDEDLHARFIEGVVSLKSGVVRIACLYLPNGNPVDTEKYPYKLKWMSRLQEFTRLRLKTEEPLILAGDFNVIPAPADVHNPAAWVNDALFKPQTRESFQALLGLGLTDALRAVTDEPGQYTFWDYQAGAWQKNWGIRIDHLLLSPQASDRLTNVGIDKYVRAWEKPSDHVPVWIDLDLEAA
jgi:exodeoxyribonuclease-3